MTQEDRELLLKDLCSRLPYGVKIQYHHIQETITDILIDINMFGRVNVFGHVKDICDVKPYLFPLSSMSEEQKNQLEEIWGTYMDKAIDYSISGEDELCDLCQLSAAEKVIDWLISNHFDFRGLIKKGLAIDATNIKVY